jgi:hypothetical protein
MRRCHALFRPSGALFRLQFSADYTIGMFGSDFRQGQVVRGVNPWRRFLGVAVLIYEVSTVRL